MTTVEPGRPATGLSPDALAALTHVGTTSRTPAKRDPDKHLSLTQSASDLTIDELLLLHSIGWEPTLLVTGASVTSVRRGTFMLGRSDPDRARRAYTAAVATAVERIEKESSDHHGVGVVGVQLETEVTHHTIEVILTGTAVRPTAKSEKPPTFVSDLGVRDFCLLHNAGWHPVGLAFGASFVQVPRRSATQTLRQSTANVELTNMTNALYEAREEGMERMQSSALALGGTGMVDVNYYERPLPFNSHIVEFRAWGTAIRLGGDAHRYLRPRVVMPLNDRIDMFDVGALGNA